MMWYTRRTIYRHQDPRGDLKFTDDPKRKLFLERAIESTLPKAFRIKHTSNVTMVEDDLWNRENSDDAINTLLTI